MIRHPAATTALVSVLLALNAHAKGRGIPLALEAFEGVNFGVSAEAHRAAWLLSHDEGGPLTVIDNTSAEERAAAICKSLSRRPVGPGLLVSNDSTHLLVKEQQK